MTDLAESAGVGRVTQRLLLDDCKLNAVLRITLRLTQVSGDRIFRRTEASQLEQRHNVQQVESESEAESSDDAEFGMPMSDDDASQKTPHSGAPAHNTAPPKAAASSRVGHSLKVADALDKLPTHHDGFAEERLQESFRDAYPPGVIASRVPAELAVDGLLSCINLHNYDSTAKTAEAAALDLDSLSSLHAVAASMEASKAGTRGSAFESAPHNAATSNDYTESLIRRKHHRELQSTLRPRAPSGGVIPRCESVDPFQDVDDVHGFFRTWSVEPGRDAEARVSATQALSETTEIRGRMKSMSVPEDTALLTNVQQETTAHNSEALESTGLADRFIVSRAYLDIGLLVDGGTARGRAQRSTNAQGNPRQKSARVTRRFDEWDVSALDDSFAIPVGAPLSHTIAPAIYPRTSAESSFVASRESSAVD
eukprot:CAMPEP_0185838730 /NCGR_PEP_ID=MMETSP1353-20130828/13496_1 /TAXON_ID=1077150 /ORGANISM="Erythrolobus australicus, Strain CCMP3124" /LENGTH=424 /DNA_ID=CAMNT_0028537819 /DNA_START=216 /DNA_END=1490 /DNA_ORIENTATION=+